MFEDRENKLARAKSINSILGPFIYSKRSKRLLVTPELKCRPVESICKVKQVRRARVGLGRERDWSYYLMGTEFLFEIMAKFKVLEIDGDDGCTIL